MNKPSMCRWKRIVDLCLAGITSSLLMLEPLSAQQAVPVDTGSYAEYTPEHEDYLVIEGVLTDVDLVTSFLNRVLYIDPSKAGEPVPTNDWWTDLIFNQYSGNMWAYPLTAQANADGINIYFPIAFTASGTDMLVEYPIGVNGQVAIVLDESDTILADFEGGTWPTGWTETGTAFGAAPAAGTVTGQSVVTGYNGSGLANSFHGGDAATGTLSSPTFTIDAQYIHALVGGGNHPGDAEIRLIVGGNTVRTATGVNSEELAWNTWDVSEYDGLSAHVEVVDNVTGGWGHILADQIVMTDDDDPASKFSTDFSPASAVALDWSDWLVQMRLAQNENAYLDVTMGHGLPFVWVESTGITPWLQIDASAIFRDTSGTVVTLPYTGAALAVEVQGRAYGLHAPDGTTFEEFNDGVLVESGGGSYLAISALPDASDLSAFDAYAYAIPRNTVMTWSYDPADGYVRTNWTVTASALKGTSTTVLQGWIPHHYRETDNDLTFTGDSYLTPRGKLKLSASNTAQIDFPFTGILPNLPVPKQLGVANDYSQERMDFYLDQYATRTEYGGDTYWGGKSLTQFGDYMTIAADLGSDNFDALKASLTAALADWFTYDGMETEYYFARYDGYKALVGFNESYGSSQFTDHHFHYGYFTRASALLGLQDPEFLEDYGAMARLVAKQYANWDRTDTDFPFMRTFDLWHGHSYAGGLSAGNGNNQESSSESIQSWCGLFLLGQAMGDSDMAAAGAMGYAIERLAIKEYWFDYHGNPDATNPVTGDGGTLPTEYGHELAGIVFDSGPAYATFFSGDPGWMYGIQWLPIQPGLAYLGEDPAFYKSQMNSMIQDRVPTMGGAARGVIRDYNLAPAQTDWHTANTEGALEKFKNAIQIAYDHNPDYTLAETNNPLYVNGELSFTIEVDGAITLDPTIWSAATLDSYTDLVPPAIGQPLDGWPLYDYLYVNYDYDDAYLSDLWEFEVLNYQSGVDTEQAKKVIGDWGVGLGNVILGYMAHYDAAVVAELMDEFYEDEHPIGISNDTSGLTYYYAHALRNLGHIVYDRHVSIPTSQVFYNPDTSVYSYAVYNPSDTEQLATVYDDTGTVIATFLVPARKLIQHKLDEALDSLQITASNTANTITPGSNVQFSVTGYDQYGATFPLTNIAWAVDAGGTIDQNGLFNATTDADPVIVTVTADGLEETYSFRVGDAPYLADIIITPDFAQLEVSTTQAFSAEGVDQYGDEYALPTLTWSVTDGGSIDAGGLFSSNGTAGAYYVVADTGNASQTALFSVHPALQNIAAGKTTYASPDPVTGAALAVDSDPNTRWESMHGDDDQWFYVDLGAEYAIKRIVIDWEGAFASEYELQVSDDATNWTTFLTVENADASDDDLSVSTSGRYVRFQGISRGLPYGYSFWEFEVYGLAGSDSISATQLFLNPTDVEMLNGMSTDFDAYAFDANWNGGETDLIDWSVDTGSIDTAGTYTSTEPGGPFTVTASFTGTVSGGGSLEETATVTVAAGASYINMALYGTAEASSYEGAAMDAAAAIDGDAETRWSSDAEDDESITVDLGSSLYVDSVILYWEAAYGEDYDIQLSDDGTNFTTVLSVTGSDGGMDDLPIGATGRYVRMQGVARGTVWGYSLFEFEVYALGTPPTTNLAEGQSVTASSVQEGTAHVAANAVDGDDTGTRWSSDFTDDEWIYVDLGSIQAISQVVLTWEGAYGSEYKIQVSDDASTWTDILTVTDGDGGVDDLSVTGTGRYVRMLGVDRATEWGYSLYEFEVYQ